MGGVGDFVFGDSQEAKQIGNVENLAYGQKAIYDKLWPMLLGQLGKGVSSYPGTYTPGATSSQQSGFDLANLLASGGDPNYNQGMQALQNILKPYDDTAATEYWQKSVRDPSLKTFEDDILPSVLEPFVGQGGLDSGASRRMVARAGTDLAEGLDANLAKTLFQDRQQHTMNQMSSMPQLQNMLTMPIQTAMAAGGVERGIQGQQGQEKYRDWMYEQDYNNPWINRNMWQSMNLGVQQPIVQGPTQQTGFLQDFAMPAAGMAFGSPGFWNWLGR